MNRRIIVLVAAAIIIGAAAWSAPVNVGSAAPAIQVQGTDGKTHGMRDYVGRKWLVVAWYPKAMTPG